MENIEKLIAIAEYDGWAKTGLKHVQHDYGFMYERKRRLVKGKEQRFLKDVGYLTSLDWLHPVAMKLIAELTGVEAADRSEAEDIGYCRSNIRRYCSTEPVKGEYVDLFNAVHEAIVFLKARTKGTN